MLLAIKLDAGLGGWVEVVGRRRCLGKAGQRTTAIGNGEEQRAAIPCPVGGVKALLVMVENPQEEMMRGCDERTSWESLVSAS